ncbi:MAG: hypothetical protein HOH36_10960 [Acidimicrobiaceae bacterium]|nr:hypothetical protein [Acidimicrobiaceae bacterium]
MDSRTRVFGGLLLVGFLIFGIIGLVVWRGAQAVDSDSVSSLDSGSDHSDSGSDHSDSGADTALDDTATDDTATDDTATDDTATDDGTSTREGPLADFVSEAVAFIEDLRGAPFQARPVVVALSDADFIARVESVLEAEFADNPELVEQDTVVQRAIGFISPDQTSDEVLRQFLAAGVLGFYDPETKELVVRQVFELDLLTKSTIVHELTHAYDDQLFDLDRPELDDDDFTERSWTFAALAEGSASHVETAWVNVLSSREQSDLLYQESSFGDPGVFASFDFAYLLLQVSVYVEGEPYVDSLVANGGYGALDAAFEGLPLTSEQIMERDPAVDTVPVYVPVPPADGEVVWEGTGGQIVLDSLFSGTFTATEDAATGWGGDAMVVYRADGQSCMRWDIVMDSVADEEELFAGLAEWTALRGGSVSIVDGRVRLDRCA